MCSSSCQEYDYYYNDRLRNYLMYHREATILRWAFLRRRNLHPTLLWMNETDGWSAMAALTRLVSIWCRLMWQWTSAMKCSWLSSSGMFHTTPLVTEIHSYLKAYLLLWQKSDLHPGCTDCLGFDSFARLWNCTEDLLFLNFGRSMWLKDPHLDLLFWELPSRSRPVSTCCTNKDGKKEGRREKPKFYFVVYWLLATGWASASILGRG
jgi:hypothetical protein